MLQAWHNALKQLMEIILLNFITSVLLNVFCVYLFTFLYLEKLKSTCKHVLHHSHHSPRNVVWQLFVSCLLLLFVFVSWKNITKKLMKFLFQPFFEETNNSCNSNQLRIDLDSLVLQKHLLHFCNSCISVT